MAVHYYDRLLSFEGYFSRFASSLDNVERINTNYKDKLINKIASSIFLIDKEINCMPIWDESQASKIRARFSACDDASDNIKGILKKIEAKDSSSKVVAEKSNSKLVFRYFYACLDSFRSGVPFNPSDLPEINEIISQLASELKEISEDDVFYPKLSEILRRISNFRDRLENSCEFLEIYSDDIDSIPVDLESGLEEESMQLGDIPSADNIQGILRKIRAKDSNSDVEAEKNASKLVFKYFYACLDSLRSGEPFNRSDLPEINKIISQLASELKEINVDDVFYPKLSEILRRISNFRDRLENSYGFAERYSDDIDSIPVDIEPGLEEEPEQLEDIPSIVKTFNETLDLNLSSLKNQKIFYQQLNNQIESISSQIKIYSEMYSEASKLGDRETIDLLYTEDKRLKNKIFELNAYKIELDSKFLFFKETDQFIIDGDGKISTIRGESLFSRIKSILLRLFFSRGVS